MHGVPRLVKALAAAILLSLAASAGATPLHIESQRETFSRALPLAQSGTWQQVEPYVPTLQDYPLMPDLRVAWLHRRLGRGTDAEVAAILERYPDYGFATGLRKRWAESLLRRQQWDDYLDIYTGHLADAKDNKTHCKALTARLRRGGDGKLVEDALGYWMSGFSQPKECDPVFAWLGASGELTDERRRQRMMLALEGGQFRLARYLARPLPAADRKQVDSWAFMHRWPQRSLGRPDRFEDTRSNRRYVSYGLKRLARSDPPGAAVLWADYRDRLSFDAESSQAVGRRIALVHAQRHLPGARDLLAAQIAEHRDEDLVHWQIRAALWDQDWPAVERALDALDATEAAAPDWQYWRARALEAQGHVEEAREIYAELASERGYHSFLAADRLGVDYAWSHRKADPDETVIAELETRPEMLRARELFMTGLTGRGRIEWQRMMKRMTEDERAQAALLAHRWNWHSRAIRAASDQAFRDDLEIRFPTPWLELYTEQTDRQGVDIAWAYGITRSESLFMPDVRSHAGAVGLMQLMPETGRQTARRAHIPWRGRRTLQTPKTNVTLGTRYLSEMQDKFGSRVLATAAYNAGPHRVNRWVPKDREVPADIWIENIPFRETRGYVKRVLASDAVFHWRLSGETRRISTVMPAVGDAPGGSG